MSNLLSYCGLVDARTSVSLITLGQMNRVYYQTNKIRRNSCPKTDNKIFVHETDCFQICTVKFYCPFLIFFTGKSLLEALILASTNPQYDKRLFIDLPVQYMKTTSSEHKNINCLFIFCFDIQNNLGMYF